MQCDVCASPAHLACEDCHQAFYCSEKCQSIDFDYHDEHVCYLPEDLCDEEVMEDVAYNLGIADEHDDADFIARGRAIKSAIDGRAWLNEWIARDIVEAPVPHPLEADEVEECALCGAPATITCGQCYDDCYCGAECQAQDWARHEEHVCYAVHELSDDEIMEEIQDHLPHLEGDALESALVIGSPAEGREWLAEHQELVGLGLRRRKRRPRRRRRRRRLFGKKKPLFRRRRRRRRRGRGTAPPPRRQRQGRFRRWREKLRANRQRAATKRQRAKRRKAYGKKRQDDRKSEAQGRQAVRKDAAQERREDRKDSAQERRENQKDVRQERREDKKDERQERREDNRDYRQERREARKDDREYQKGLRQEEADEDAMPAPEVTAARAWDEYYYYY